MQGCNGSHGTIYWLFAEELHSQEQSNHGRAAQLWSLSIYDCLLISDQISLQI